MFLFMAAVLAKGKVLFAVVSNDAVGYAILAKAVQDAIDRRPVNGAI
jgi:hypothetical protein